MRKFNDGAFPTNFLLFGFGPEHGFDLTFKYL